MTAPIMISSAFVLAIIVICRFKPNTGRIFLGFFFLVMALGVNGYFTFGNPQSYLDYAASALIPCYGRLAVAIVSINPVAFGLLLMAFEISMAVLLLSRKMAVKIGLFGTMVFVAGIAPLSWVQIPWLGLIIAQIFCFRQEYEQSLFQMIKQKFFPGEPYVPD